ncbi:MAG: AAA family ATPase, partial [Candidatus Eremiobacteraeota bacterium]|nr:AAA family ATPase [Candidatus Eremiobacteraeota bacterium]
FTPDLMPADICGVNLIEEHEGVRRFVFNQGPIFASLVLADEINRATPKTQSALLEAMQERQVTAAGAIRPLPRPFFVLVTQNPIEMEGTYPLPEAQVDRFFFKLWVEFPGADDLAAILDRTTGAEEAEIEAVCSGEELLEMQLLARQVVAAEALTHYAARLVLATHPERPEAPEDVRRFVRFGSSPRGAQTLLLAAKARALSQGRFNVAFEDIAAVARPTLRHRIILSFEGEAEGFKTDTLIDRLLEEVPREPAAVG